MVWDTGARNFPDLLGINEDECGLDEVAQSREGSGIPIIRYRAATPVGTLAMETLQAGHASKGPLSLVLRLEGR